MPRITLFLFILAACAPKDPATSESASDGSGSSTSSASTSSASTISTSTTSASTGEPTSSSTGGSPTASTGEPTSASTGATTGELPACSWRWPEYQGLQFCPPLAGMNADIAGSTPNGPVSLHYAHFGLFLCAECPHADDGQLRLYADPPALGEPAGDYLALVWLSPSSLELGTWVGPGEIGGQTIDMFPTDITLEDAVIPPVEQTSPPLDEAAPPVVSGTLHLTGNGWDVHGTFTAPLCTALDWTPPCE